MSHNNLELATELSQLFRESVSVDDVECNQLGTTSVAVAKATYRTDSTDSRSTRTYKQTTILLNDEDLDLPPFTLQPISGGVFGKLLLNVGGVAEVKFPEAAQFHQNYQLLSWVPDAARVLFTTNVLKHFASHPGWSVRGEGRRLVVFMRNQIAKPDEIESFVQQALEIMALFQEAELELDARPNLNREVTQQSVAQSLAESGGLIGSLMEKRIQKVSVSPQQMDEFARSSLPRKIPEGIQRQAVGENLPLIVVGIVFVLFGLNVGSFWIAMAEGGLRWVGLAFLIPMPSIGTVMSVMTIRHRRSKLRTLHGGKLVHGTVTRIEKTSVTVNNQLRFHIWIDVKTNEEERMIRVNAYGRSVDKARRLMESTESVRVLLDPQDQQHGICLDLLTVLG